MTALDRYQRLETGGLWRAAPDEQRREVVISFGNATLVIADTAGRPLAHWSLPAVLRQNPGHRPAIYAPDDEASETLEVSDDLMIEAIEQVRNALAKSRPNPGKLRQISTIAISFALLGLAVFWLPGALTRQTLAVVPISKRTEIGAMILGHIQRETGAACRERSGNAAAERLVARLLGPDTTTQLVILPALAQGSVALPGGITILDQAVLGQTDDPAVAAGYVLAAEVVRGESDPLAQILTRSGLATTLRLLTTGEIPSEILQDYAAEVLAGGDQKPSASRLRAAFAEAKVPSAPYVAMSAARSDGATLIAEDAVTAGESPLILSDDDWVSLQNICNS